MTDNTELKRLAEAATPGPWYQHGGIMQVLSHDCETVCETFEDDGECPDAQFIAAANPAAVLALIADLDEARNGMKHSCAIRLKKRIELLETQRDQLIADNERLTKAVGLQVIRRFVGDDDQKNIDELVAAGIQVDKELIVQLKAENERLSTENSEIESAAITYIEDMQEAQRENARLTELFTVGMTLDGNLRVYGDWQSVRKAQEILAERDQLRAEIAGLKTGYEAYEQVNAELKAEVEGLRDDLDQVEYDANAWRNGEESVWIEVFNIEGDDPFICAISGKITVEQLALIQAEILEYREDYFEKGSGLYVFRCAHCQAHYDNVGMTEPAHWETDFESFSPFPWEEEAAALGQGEQL